MIDTSLVPNTRPIHKQTYHRAQSGTSWERGVGSALTQRRSEIAAQHREVLHHSLFSTISRPACLLVGDHKTGHNSQFMGANHSSSSQLSVQDGVSTRLGYCRPYHVHIQEDGRRNENLLGMDITIVRVLGTVWIQCNVLKQE